MRLKQTDIRKAWDDIKPDLTALKDRFNHEWRIEDIYAACLTGKAFLYMDDANFVILHDRINEFTAECELFIWVAYSHDRNSLDDYYGDICEIAKGIGASVITFSSKRQGFIKVAKDNHWKLRESIYELRVV